MLKMALALKMLLLIPRWLMMVAPRSIRIRRLIRQMRSGRQMTQSALAKKLHVTPNYLYLLESGHKFPSLNLCLHLARFFGFNPNWIKCLWLRDYLIWTEAKVRTKLDIAY